MGRAEICCFFNAPTCVVGSNLWSPKPDTKCIHSSICPKSLLHTLTNTIVKALLGLQGALIIWYTGIKIKETMTGICYLGGVALMDGPLCHDTPHIALKQPCGSIAWPVGRNAVCTCRVG